MNVTKSAEKVDEKIVFICLVFMFSSSLTVLKLPKKVHLLQFCADFGKKATSFKAIYMYASESSNYTPSENMVYRGLSHRS